MEILIIPLVVYSIYMTIMFAGERSDRKYQASMYDEYYSRYVARQNQCNALQDRLDRIRKISK